MLRLIFAVLFLLFLSANGIIITDKLNATTQSCVEGLKIRDGSTEDNKVSLSFGTFLILSVEVQYPCATNQRLNYQWDVFESRNGTSLDRKVNLESPTSQNVLLLKRHEWVGGSYVAKLVVKDIVQGHSVGQWESSVSLTVERRKLEVSIQGGSSIELGGKSLNRITLEVISNIDLTDNIPTFHWFCSTSREQLPSSSDERYLRENDDCIIGKTQFIEGKSRAFFDLAKAVDSSPYFFRVFVTSDEWDSGFADQQVNVLPNNASKISIRCWQNCGSRKPHGRPLVLQVECEACENVEWFWSFRGETQVPLIFCQNKVYCKLEGTQFEYLFEFREVTIEAKAISKGESIVAFYDVAFHEPPTGSCAISPSTGSAYVTEFDVTCIGISPRGLSLTYKFYMKDTTGTNDHHNPEYLLQFGFERALANLTLPIGDVTIRVEICDDVASCVIRKLSIQVKRDDDIEKWFVIPAFRTFWEAGDLSKIMQMAILVLEKPNQDWEVEEIITSLDQLQPTTLETSLQFLHIYQSVTKHGGNLTDVMLNKVLDKIQHMESNIISGKMVKLRNISALVLESTFLMTQVLKTSDAQTSIRGSLLIAALVRHLTTKVLPEEARILLRNKAIQSFAARTTQIGTEFSANDVTVSNINQLFPADCLNMEIITMDGTLMNFNSSTSKVDKVQVISVTTGCRNQQRIPPESSINLPVRFSIAKQFLHQDTILRLHITSNCDVTKCRSDATGSLIATRSVGAQSANDSVLVFDFKNPNSFVRNLEFNLTDLDDDNRTIIRKRFFPFGSKKSLTIPLDLLRASRTFRVSARVDLGSVYFRRRSAIEIKLSVYELRCYAWNDVTNDWDTSGCKMSGDYTCQCRTFRPLQHSPNVGNVNGIVASKVDHYKMVAEENQFLESWLNEVLGNPMYVCVVASALVVYLMLFVWLRSRSQTDMNMFFVEPGDNSPFDDHTYYVTIYTGSRRYAGTTASVAMTLIGTKGKSRIHLIQKGTGEKYLARGSVITVLIKTPGSLGDLVAIRAWHDCNGESPEWYLQRIVVQEASTGKCFFFFCYSWLDRVCDRIFAVASEKLVQSYRSRFRVKCENYLRDRHLLYSLFGMRPWDVLYLTRLERISCCCAHVFAIMLASLLFHVENTNRTGLTAQLAYYSFKWSDVAVGLQSAAICLPIVIFVEAIFRLSHFHGGKVDIRDFDTSSYEDDVSDFWYESSDETSSNATENGGQISSDDDHSSQGSDTDTTASESEEFKATGSETKCETNTNSVVLEFTAAETVNDLKVSESMSQLNDEKKDAAFFPSARSSSSMYILQKNSGGAMKKGNTLFHILLSLLGWCLTSALIVTSSVFCILLGIREGPEMGTEWFVSVISGILEQLFFLETAKAVILAFAAALYDGKSQLSDWLAPCGFYSDSIAESTPLYNHPIKEQMRQNRMRKTEQSYLPPTEELIHQGELVRQKEREVKRRIKKLSVHIIYLILLLVASFGQRGTRLYHFGRTLDIMFRDGLNQISSRDDVYTWTMTTLAETMTREHKEFFTDEQIVFIGWPRLRQKRVVGGLPCPHASTLKQVNMDFWKECTIAYTNNAQDIGEYQPGWSTVGLQSSFDDVATSAWNYTSVSAAWFNEFIGEYATYNAGGYYFTLPKRKAEIVKQTEALKHNNWVDKYTRLVMMEAVVYNAVYRNYAVVNIAIEVNNIGRVYKRINLSLMRSHHIQSTADVIVNISLYLILAMVFYNMTEISNKIVEERHEFFHSVWNIIHVTTLMTSVAAVAMYLTRASYTDHALQAYFQSHPHRTFELFHAAAKFDYITRCLLSGCVFFTMLYTVKILEGHTQFVLMHHTLRRTALEVFGHSAYMLFLYCAFCHVGVILFSDTLDFSTNVRTMQSVLGFSMEAFTSSDLLNQYPSQGGFYLLAFFTIFTKVFVNFYATILENCYRESKLMLKDRITTENVISFGRKQIRSLFTIKDQRLEKMKTEQPEKYAKLLKTGPYIRK